MPAIENVALRTLLLGYVGIVNLVAFCQMGADKKRAKNGQRRIREKVLFLTAAIGGSLGANLGMRVFRHKTKHRSFVFGMPAIFIAHLLIAFLFFKGC